MTNNQSTIFALSSAAGRAGVSVIRVSGPETKNCLQAFCGSIPKARFASLKNIKDPLSKEVIDQGLVLWFPAPHSFTGEDCAEFQIHGGVAVIAKLLSSLSNFSNLRMAEAGEFARSAFDNGKLDLTQIEGLADLINADTEQQRKQAVLQSTGFLGELYQGWRKQLIETMTLLTAAIDFSDEEDIASDIVDGLKSKVSILFDEIKNHLEDGHRGEIVRDGYQVVLAGVPNVGKSSLLNALARRDVAIVSEEAGTTRDVIDVSLDLDGYPIKIMDTAGLRKTSSEVENEGIRRTIEKVKDADLIIWLMDAQKPEYEMPTEISTHKNVISILNKIDLLDTEEEMKIESDLTLSLKKKMGLNKLIKTISGRAKNYIGDNMNPVISRERYRNDLEKCLFHMKTFLDHSLDETELRAEDMRLAANSIGRITGEIDVEDLLDLLFSEFCIGK